MECDCIAFREIPRSSRLFLDFLCNFSRVAAFYAFDPFQGDSFRRAAERIRGDDAVRNHVADVLLEQNRACGAGPATEQNIEKLRAGACAVVTGQQVGLFTGPSFSIYKSLTVIRVAQKLSAEGIPAIPVFWLAGEDHDLAEVNHCTVLDGEGRLYRLEDTSALPTGKQVGEVRLQENIRELRHQLATLWSAMPEAASLEALLETYEPGVTYPTAFARLLHRLLAGTGIVCLDPLDVRLAHLTTLLIGRALDEAAHLHRRLAERDRALERGRYHTQVHLRENATLVFLNVNGTRQPVRRRGDSFQVTGRGVVSRKELLEELEQHPERFSPNVLLRPLVQDTLLPTVAYVGGPAEIAYYAQAGALYDELLGRMPVILPRASFTLVPRSLRRLLAKYQLDLRDLFRPRQDVYTRMAEQRLPPELQRKLKAAEKRIERMLAELAPVIRRLDPTTAGAVETSRRKMLYQFRKLCGRVARARAARQGLLARHLEQLTSALYPHRELQERTLNFFSFLARYGLDLIPRLSQQLALPCRDHQVIYLDR